jgi:hypothetical protein
MPFGNVCPPPPPWAELNITRVYVRCHVELVVAPPFLELKVIYVL